MVLDSKRSKGKLWTQQSKVLPTPNATAPPRSGRPTHRLTDTPRTTGGYRARRSGIAPQTPRHTDGGEAESHTHRSSADTLHVSARSMWPALSPLLQYRLFNGGVRPRAAPSRSRRETSEPHAMRACAMAPCLRPIEQGVNVRQPRFCTWMATRRSAARRCPW